MSAFAVVRHREDLVERHSQLNALLALRSPVRSGMQAEALLGVWLDPALADTLPPVIAVPDAPSSAEIRVRESTGVGGVWAVCYCDSAGAEADLSRAMLVKALAAASGSERDAVSFAPVFPADASLPKVQMEVAQLQRLDVACILAPLYQHSATGTLSHDRS